MSFDIEPAICGICEQIMGLAALIDHLIDAHGIDPNELYLGPDLAKDEE